MDQDRLAAGLAALIRGLRPDAPATLDAAIAADLPRLLATDPGDDDPERSLTAADLYRIRAAKLVARHLPPGALADPARRAALRAEVRRLIEAHLGPLRPSRYLDRPR